MSEGEEQEGRGNAQAAWEFPPASLAEAAEFAALFAEPAAYGQSTAGHNANNVDEGTLGVSVLATLTHTAWTRPSATPMDCATHMELLSRLGAREIIKPDSSLTGEKKDAAG